MEFTKATRKDSTLENGSQKIVFHAQWRDYFFELSFVSVPRIINSSISFNVFDQFAFSKEKMCTQIGLLSVSYLSNPSGSPYYNISPTTPRHSLILDSSVLNPHGFLEPSLQSFGLDPSHFNENLRLLSNFLYNFFSFKLVFSQKGEHVNFVAQTNCYDLRTTHFLVPKCGRVWRLERTMTRVMTRELEQLIGGVITHYKGVRWRPERKHPWVAEIKVSRKTKRKMWLGNYDTPEEAARAYDIAVIQYGKQTTLNFKDSCEHVSNSTTQSTMSSDPKVVVDNSFQISTSQSMLYDTRTSVEEPTMQGRSMPTCALDDQDCKMNSTLLQVDFQSNSKAMIALEIDPTLQVANQAPEEISTYNKSFGMVDHKSKSYFMFASDLPGMVDMHYPSQRTGSTSRIPMRNMYSYEFLRLGAVEGEVVESVEMNSKVKSGASPSPEGAN